MRDEEVAGGAGRHPRLGARMYRPAGLLRGATAKGHDDRRVVPSPGCPLRRAVPHCRDHRGLTLSAYPTDSRANQRLRGREDTAGSLPARKPRRRAALCPALCPAVSFRAHAGGIRHRQTPRSGKDARGLRAADGALAGDSGGLPSGLLKALRDTVLAIGVGASSRWPQVAEQDLSVPACKRIRRVPQTNNTIACTARRN